MGKCPAPWCGVELPPDTTHPQHEAWMKDPDWEYYGDKQPDGSVDVFRRPKKKKA